jgi:hypothetical protein
MRSYDGYPLLEYLIDNGMRPKKIIFQGSKIMYMQVGRGLNMRVIDSLNFLPMKLAAFPQVFDLGEMKKGWFPYLFNTRENQEYVGPYPDPKYYCADFMSSKDRKLFFEWYSTKQGVIFDFRKEMLEYCQSDTYILQQGCQKFRQLMMKATSDIDNSSDTDGQTPTNCLDPFQNLTIASVCMAIYKAKFLEEDWQVKLEDENGEKSEWVPAKLKNGKLSVIVNNEQVVESDLQATQNVTIVEKKFVRSPLAQVPSEGYVKRDNHSKESIQWLEWLMYQSRQEGNPIDIKHALNGGEKKVLKEIKPNGRRVYYKLDGYYEQEGQKVAVEYHGCLYHGCESCYPNDRGMTKHPRTKQSIEELYTLTMLKKQKLESMGFTYKCIWAHAFHEMKKTNEDLNKFLSTLDISDRLVARDAFFGGRTDCTKVYYKCKEGEKIRYVDFTSLYPYINKYSRTILYHPEIIVDNFKPIQDYFGIAKVKILPPPSGSLYHAVLPYRMANSRLCFPLCKRCADLGNQNNCHCTNEQKSIIGTWCTPEIHKAVEKGYKVMKIYEVYHWSETTLHNVEKKEGGLFTEYVNLFLKFKQQASDWPEWCKVESDRTKYLQDYADHEGVHLDWQKIEKNPGLRSLAKLCLNSFWGKFGQRLNMSQTTFIHESEADQFFQYLSDPSKEVTNFTIISDSMIQLDWAHESAFVPENMQSNIFIAIMTTCAARLKLYDLLDQLGDRVLYHDTDSAVLVSRPGDEDPILGDYLGELTDELEGDYITEFVSTGPKSYAYMTNKGKEVCKVKGFTLNYTNSNIINFDSIKNMVTKYMDDRNNPCNKMSVKNPTKICRDPKKRKLYSREETKDMKMVYTKRKLLNNYNTVPFGY